MEANEGFYNECAKLREQLAEKEKEIEKLELMLDKVLTELHTNCYSGLNIIHFKEMMINDLGGIAITHNKTKFDYAVEQLERVKELVEKTRWLEKAEEVIEEYIDQLITEIKEGK